MTGSGTAAGAKDIAGQRAVLLAGGISEGTGDCPLGRASALGDGFLVPTPRLPDHEHLLVEEHSQDFSSAWFIVSERSWVEISLVSSASLRISSRLSTLGTRSRPNF